MVKLCIEAVSQPAPFVLVNLGGMGCQGMSRDETQTNETFSSHVKLLCFVSWDELLFNIQAVALQCDKLLIVCGSIFA